MDQTDAYDRADLGLDTKEKLDEIIARWRGRPGELLGILEDAQEADERHWLPEITLRYLGSKTGVPLSKLYSVATFYSFFNLRPQGDHSVVVCRGTACHTRGSKAILTDALTRLGLSPEGAEDENSFTTEDALFTVRTVACFGQCALAPVVSVDGIIHSRMTSGKLITLLGKVAKGARR